MKTEPIATPSATTTFPGVHFPKATPESVGMNSERLSGVSSSMNKFVDSGLLPCVLTAVARHGRLVHFDFTGWADVEKKVPIKADTIFRIFSMSKVITGIATMIMYEKGHFFLVDPISKYLPEFADMMVHSKEGPVPAANQITIRQLLTHTSGLQYPMYSAFPNADVPPNECARRAVNMSLEEAVKEVAALPLEAEPGSKWLYGDSMLVLGRLLEVVTGKSFGEVLNEELFEPLQMVDSGFHVPKNKLDRMSNLYEQKPAGFEFIAPEDDHQFGGDYTRPDKPEVGGAGLLSTASDLLRFSQMLHNGGLLDGTQVLSPVSTRFILSNQLGPEFGPNPLNTLPVPNFDAAGLGFGVGGMVVTDPVAAGSPGSKGEFGWSGWANTHFWIDPELGITGMCLSQMIGDLTGACSEVPMASTMRQQTYQAVSDL